MKVYYLQDIIQGLEEFWMKQGCVLLHSYDANLGAGTLSPYTILYTLKKPVWNACYIQYSRRPTDGRFGQNPNRLCGYYQFQVIMKPNPEDIKQKYLESLHFLGIDETKNDIRFVEDDWENPSIGAAGVGWEVWINGMEATQFTYMKQIGGFELDNVAAEITYGVERFAMYIQGKNNLFELEWNENVLYKDIFYEAEVEYSEYFKNQANVEQFKRNFFECLENAVHLSSKSLIMPAYDECTKASHYLNILDARGAISALERTKFILQVREATKDVCAKLLDPS
jgi:glycyl-tRNA synthetase alpha chain